MLARKSLGCLDKTVGRNMDIKADSDERSEGKEESYTESFIFIIIKIYIYLSS